METAALLPAAIAEITVDGPDTMSPPANSPGTVVSMVSGWTLIVRPSSSATPAGIAAVSALCPTANMTVSASSTLVVAGS